MVGVFEEPLVYKKSITIYFFVILKIQQIYAYVKGQILIIYNYSLLISSIHGFIDLAPGLERLDELDHF